MLSKWFPAIATIEDAMKLAKQGAIGVLLFTAMNILGAVFAYFLSQNPNNAESLNAQGVREVVLGITFLIPFLLLFAWRIYKGKGWLVSGLVII